MTLNRQNAKLAPRRQRLVAQNPTALWIVRHNTFDGVPKLRAVVHDPQVAELMGDYIVDHVQFMVDQPPIQSDRTIGRRGTPTRGGTAE